MMPSPILASQTQMRSHGFPHGVRTGRFLTRDLVWTTRTSVLHCPQVRGLRACPWPEVAVWQGGVGNRAEVLTEA